MAASEAAWATALAIERKKRPSQVGVVVEVGHLSYVSEADTWPLQTSKS